ncbi:MAG: KpsF/GutQ family sugar-phosphate isomerase [Nitrospinae bacterium]|nr:KpsF/GutQ family sugar-phosphate isomerase [Nitrospinota bacterium]
MQRLKVSTPSPLRDAEKIIFAAKKALQIESEAVAGLIGRIDGHFAEVVNLIDRCSGRLVVTGMGKSGIIGKKIAATFSSIGVPALFLHAAEGSHGDLGMISRGDVVLAISNSGETEEILLLLSAINRLKAVLVAMTGNLNSTLARKSDYVLDVGVKEEACSLGLLPTSSTTAALALGDALALGLLAKRGFKEEDFAQNHPGGILGRKLLTTVGDVMHTGGSVPKVYEDSNIADVIKEISRKGFGTAIVVGRDDSIKGIITDGDLRRLIEKKRDISETRAGEIMSSDPKTVGKDNMAAKAVQIMEEYSITSLVVTGDEVHIDGIIHLHDLLKAGIV